LFCRITKVLRPRPVGPKLTSLLRIQEPAIVERRGRRPINSTTSSTIANRVDRSTRREPSAFERNTMGSHFDAGLRATAPDSVADSPTATRQLFKK